MINLLTTHPSTPPPRSGRGRAVVLVVVVAIGLAAGICAGPKVWRRWEGRQPNHVPVETNVAVVPSNTNAPTNTNQPVLNTNTASPLPKEINLSAPFTTQAPNANWDAVHEELCEEASVLMAARAVQGRPIKDAADAEQALQALKDWEVEHLGYYESTTAEEIASLVRGMYDLTATVISRPTAQQLKRLLADGHLIVVPAAGRELHNPNFKQPGPIYHALLLKGYTAAGLFITNDPGTRKGQNYVYAESTFMNAIHDWNGGDVMNGTPMVVVVSAGPL